MTATMQRSEALHFEHIDDLTAADLMTPGALAHQLAVFDGHPEVDIAMGLSATEDLVSGPGECCAGYSNYS